MGAPARSWGGRWTAVNSLWTYIHRLLHVIGITSIDHEELALLSAPLIRLRAFHQDLVLAHYPDPLRPDEPLGFVPSSQPPLSASLFYLHLDHSDPANPDRIRLATAAAPRAWLAVDYKSGSLFLSVSELAATIFSLQPNGSTGISLSCVCAAGRYLSVAGRARISGSTLGSTETFVLNVVPESPTLGNEVMDGTMKRAYERVSESHVRIQSKAFGWFCASPPGCDVGRGGGKEVGWDGFTLEYDCATKSARVRDSRGSYIGFNRDMNGLMADTGSGTGELFGVEIVGPDDRVQLRSRKGYVSVKRGGRVVLSQSTLPGKREQFYLRLALPSMMDESRPRLRMRTCDGGARQVEASVTVPAQADVAYQVLCDYEGFCNFVRDASESRILERTGERTLKVLMVQCHSFLMLTIPMRMELDVVEYPEDKKVSMNLLKGFGVKLYRGVWQAVETPDGRCQMKCSLTASTSVPAPGFLLDGLISHATKSTMEQLRVECIRRTLTAKSGKSKKFLDPMPVLVNASKGKLDTS